MTLSISAIKAFNKSIISIFTAEAFDRSININEYRLYHIDVKNIIVFAILRIKEYYDTHY